MACSKSPKSAQSLSDKCLQRPPTVSIICLEPFIQKSTHAFALPTSFFLQKTKSLPFLLPAKLATLGREFLRHPSQQASLDFAKRNPFLIFVCPFWLRVSFLPHKRLPSPHLWAGRSSRLHMLNLCTPSSYIGFSARLRSPSSPLVSLLQGNPNSGLQVFSQPATLSQSPQQMQLFFLHLLLSPTHLHFSQQPPRPPSLPGRPGTQATFLACKSRSAPPAFQAGLLRK